VIERAPGVTKKFGASGYIEERLKTLRNKLSPSKRAHRKHVVRQRKLFVADSNATEEGKCLHDRINALNLFIPKNDTSRSYIILYHLRLNHLQSHYRANEHQKSAQPIFDDCFDCITVFKKVTMLQHHLVASY
jgi:hypothetical protein